MMRLLVRSRRWNWMLAILGSVYAVSAIVILAWFVIDVWNAESMSDRMLQFALLLSALFGIWILIMALKNLSAGSQQRWHTQRVSRSTAH